MNSSVSSTSFLTKLMFRLLPLQVLVAAVPAVGAIIANYYASNYISVEAVTAIGVHTPVFILANTSDTILIAGASLLCGKYMGQNEKDKMNNIFTVDLILATLIGAAYTALYLLLPALDLTRFLAPDPEIRSIYNSYLIGQSISNIPSTVGVQLTVFLALENRSRLSLAANIANVIVTMILDIIFVQYLHMESFGLALACSLASIVFFAIQAVYFMSGKSKLKLKLKGLDLSECKAILGIGLPSSSSYIYQAIRGYILNNLMLSVIGAVAVSAFTAANNLVALFWSVSTGMITVSRMLIGISIGAEDRRTLTDIMRVALYRFVPFTTVMALLIAALGVPLTYIFYKDPSAPVFTMTLWGMRLLPLCIPFGIIFLHYVTYAQAVGRTTFVNIIAALDGAVMVVGAAYILVPRIGINGVYYANIINGVLDVLIIIGYACLKNGRFPTTMDQFMLIPDDFGYAENDRIDIAVKSIDDVMDLSRRVQGFCKEKGIDDRRALYAGLSIEEMAGNIVEHGFVKDEKRHTVDIRVALKGDDILIGIRDDCKPFDPSAVNRVIDPDDPAKNVGIRMIYRIAKNIEYQSILGLNALTIRI